MAENDARWFTWEESVAIWLDHEHSPPPPPAPEKSERARGGGGPKNHRAEEAADAAESDEIPPGLRNDALLSLGGTMRRRGMRENEIAAALLEVNRCRCKPALPEDEVRQIAASVARYEPDDPLQFATAEPASTEAGLAALSRLLFKARVVSVRRILRRGGPGGAVDFELSDGSVVNVGTVATVLTFATFRKHLADGTRIVIPKALAEKWDETAQLILGVIEDVEGESVGGQIDTFLRSVFASHPPVEADDPEEFEALRTTRKPFLRHGERIHLRLPAIFAMAKRHGGPELKYREFGDQLARMGWTPSKPSSGGRDDRKRLETYAAPEGWDA